MHTYYALSFEYRKSAAFKSINFVETRTFKIIQDSFFSQVNIAKAK